MSKLIDPAKMAPLIFKLRDELSAIMVEHLTVTESGEIEGHDMAAEEIILLIGSED